jgi:glucan phosphoethanolaminetransferase (alkaline phosphatase superfamily)
MSQRLVGVGISGHLPTHLVLHIVLVLVLVPLLFLKILIARRYKQRHSSLKALGIAILVISFALVSVPTLSELLRSARPALLFKKRKQPHASVESSRIPEIPLLGNLGSERETVTPPAEMGVLILGDSG